MHKLISPKFSCTCTHQLCVWFRRSSRSSIPCLLLVTVMLPTAGWAVTVKDVIRIAVSEIRIGLVSGSALTSPLKVPVNLYTANHEQISAEGKYWQQLLGMAYHVQDMPAPDR